MHEYPKTENVFTRNPDTHLLNDGELRDPAHAQIGEWLITEKVDGTNIRILIRLKNAPKDNDILMNVEVRGRSDRANLPKDLEANILKIIEENHTRVFEWVYDLVQGDENITVCLYGEGYGAGIQKVGGRYRSDKSVRLFDVTTTHVEAWPDGNADGPTWWRDWNTVLAAAEATGLKTVPVLGVMPLDEAVENTRFPFVSEAAREDGGDAMAEGVVARTDPYLYNHRGHRVLVKIKTHDFKQDFVQEPATASVA